MVRLALADVIYLVRLTVDSPNLENSSKEDKKKVFTSAAYTYLPWTRCYPKSHSLSSELSNMTVKGG